MNNRVSNGVFGKIVRTFGFLLLLVSSVLILTDIILTNAATISFLSFASPYAQMVEDIVTSLGFQVAEYIFLALVVGLLFLIWAIRKGLILRVLITVLLLFVYVEAIYNTNPLFIGFTPTAPLFISSSLGLISTYLDQAITASPYIVPGASLLLVLFLWMLFANKKPKRFSVTMVRVGSIFLVLAVIVAAIPQIVSLSFAAADWYIMVTVLLYAATYLFYSVGSAFGVLGFARS